jgi:hypothetical protein
MSFLLTIYNKLAPSPTILKLSSDVGLEFKMFGSLVFIDKVALKPLKSKLYLLKKNVMPIFFFNPLPGGGGGDLLDNCPTYFFLTLLLFNFLICTY